MKRFGLCSYIFGELALQGLEALLTLGHLLQILAAEALILLQRFAHGVRAVLIEVGLQRI